jgi:hypothetical protein
MKKSYMVTLSCLRKKTKFGRHYSGLNFDGLPKTIGVSFVDHAWEMIINTIVDAKSSNFVAMELMRFLNSARVDYNVASISQTPLVGSIECPPPSSISLAMNKSP